VESSSSPPAPTEICAGCGIRWFWNCVCAAHGTLEIATANAAAALNLKAVKGFTSSFEVDETGASFASDAPRLRPKSMVLPPPQLVQAT
jgi:hypothetical protein